jgi:DNA-binding transcriptional LysR family regulator
MSQPTLGRLDHVRAMGASADRLALAASGQSQTLEGAITITASEVVAAFLLPPVLRRLRERRPGVEVSVVATNAVRDLRRREADVAIRSGRPTDPDLVATRLRNTPAHLYATPAYLKSIGRPKSPADLGRAAFVGFGDDEGRFMNGLNALGFDLKPANFPLHTGSHLVLWEMVKAGLGVGAIVEEVGDAEPGVRRALPAMAAIPVPAWLVAHREVHTSRRVRVVFDLLVEHFGPKAPKVTSGSRSPPRSRAARRG